MIKNIKNWWLIRKYPFLMPKDYFGEDIENFDFSYNELEDSIPPGWWKRFGIFWCQDFKECCEQEKMDVSKIFIVQAKEKYGGLRVYLSEYPECWRDHDYAWEYIAKHTCCQCGKFPSQIEQKTWLPLCENCIKQLNIEYAENFSPLKEYISYSSYDNMGKSIEHFVDMKPFYKKIKYDFKKGQVYE